MTTIPPPSFTWKRTKREEERENVRTYPHIEYVPLIHAGEGEKFANTLQNYVILAILSYIICLSNAGKDIQKKIPAPSYPQFAHHFDPRKASFNITSIRVTHP